MLETAKAYEPISAKVTLTIEEWKIQQQLVLEKQAYLSSATGNRGTAPGKQASATRTQVRTCQLSNTTVLNESKAICEQPVRSLPRRIAVRAGSTWA